MHVDKWIAVVASIARLTHTIYAWKARAFWFSIHSITFARLGISWNALFSLLHLALIHDWIVSNAERMRYTRTSRKRVKMRRSDAHRSSTRKDQMALEMMKAPATMAEALLCKETKTCSLKRWHYAFSCKIDGLLFGRLVLQRKNLLIAELLARCNHRLLRDLLWAQFESNVWQTKLHLEDNAQFTHILLQEILNSIFGADAKCSGRSFAKDFQRKDTESSFQMTETLHLGCR